MSVHLCVRALGVKLNNNRVKLNKLLFMCKFECARIQVASTSIPPEVFGKKKENTCSRVLENTVLYPVMCCRQTYVYTSWRLFLSFAFFLKKSFSATSCQRGLLAAELEDERRDEEHQERVQVHSEMKGGFKHIHDAASV